MALDCLGSAGNGESLELVDTAAMSYPGAGWSIFAMIYADSGVGGNTFAYVFSHGQPLAFVDAINILKEAPSGQIRVIVDSTAGNLADFYSSNTVVANQWNGVIVSYDGVNIRVTLNGTTTTASPPAFGTLNPTVNGVVGYASHGGSREWNGRIAEIAKWDRNFTIAEQQAFTKTTNLFSPLFAQNDQIWHLEMFNDDFSFDMQGNVSVVDGFSAPLFGRHANATYPVDNYHSLSTVVTPPSLAVHQPQWTML